MGLADRLSAGRGQEQGGGPQLAMREGDGRKLAFEVGGDSSVQEKQLRAARRWHLAWVAIVITSFSRRHVGDPFRCGMNESIESFSLFSFSISSFCSKKPGSIKVATMVGIFARRRLDIERPCAI